MMIVIARGLPVVDKRHLVVCVVRYEAHRCQAVVILCHRPRHGNGSYIEPMRLDTSGDTSGFNCADVGGQTGRAVCFGKILVVISGSRLIIDVAGGSLSVVVLEGVKGLAHTPVLQRQAGGCATLCKSRSGRLT